MIYLQNLRLERDFRTSLAFKDQVSFLDLAPSLRIWTEMKGDIDAIAEGDASG